MMNNNGRIEKFKIDAESESTKGDKGCGESIDFVEQTTSIPSDRMALYDLKDKRGRDKLHTRPGTPTCISHCTPIHVK
jgi:hypothetical protein